MELPNHDAEGDFEGIYETLREIERDPSIAYALTHRALVRGCREVLSEAGVYGVLNFETETSERIPPQEGRYVFIEHSESDYKPEYWTNVYTHHSVLVFEGNTSGMPYYLLVQNVEIEDGIVYGSNTEHITFNTRVLHLFETGSHAEFFHKRPIQETKNNAAYGLLGPYVTCQENGPVVINRDSRFVLDPQKILPQQWNFVEDIDEHDFDQLHMDIADIADYFRIYFPEYWWQDDIQ